MDTHDPLCPRGRSTKVPVGVCEPCYWFAQVRADERNKIIDCIEEAKTISHEMMLSGRSLTSAGFASVLERLIKESE